MATQEIRARYINGVLKPMVPMDIEEGAEVALTVTEVQAKSGQTTRKLTGLAFGAWKGVNADELKRHIYESRSQPSGRPVPKL